MALIYNKTNFTMIDERCPSDIVLHEHPTVCYTLSTDDITTGKKPKFTPFADRSAPIDEDIASLTVKTLNDGLLFELVSERSGLSEFGLNLPLNFMGKKRGGGWKNQYLFNSPYVSPDRKIMYFYLTKPNGCHIAIAVKSGAGWKMDYSPYCYAHFFTNLKLLANFDKAYNMPRRENKLVFAIFPVNDFADCFTKLSEFYGVPFVDYNVSGGAVGTAIELKVYGDCDNFKSGKFEISKSGDIEIVPQHNGSSGAVATVYGYDDLISLYEKSMDDVDMKDIAVTDGNLCEWQCWVTAMLRFLLRYKSRLSVKQIDDYESKLKSILSIITETDEDKAVPRLTIFDKEQKNGLKSYNVYNSTRIQELFFGITLLLDAYKYFGDKKYLEYVLGATDRLIDSYQKQDGRLERFEWGKAMDYTTVCCPMIPIVDVAKFIEKTDAEKAKKYYNSAKRMANYLYKRGLVFPTEGEESDLTDTEMEDGSISCTALCLLYYCKNVESVDKYIDKAKEILDIHDNWVMNTPVAQMHGSTLRWWETLWEGDADGPSLCCGHAWTIWRSEADYLYYELFGNKEYLQKAQNGFMTNLSKIRENGKSYSAYCVDEIPGGGFAETSDNVNIRIADKFPQQTDSGLSRYVWIRMCDTFLNKENNRTI